MSKQTIVTCDRCKNTFEPKPGEGATNVEMTIQGFNIIRQTLIPNQDYCSACVAEIFKAIRAVLQRDYAAKT